MNNSNDLINEINKNVDGWYAKENEDGSITVVKNATSSTDFLNSNDPANIGPPDVVIVLPAGTELGEKIEYNSFCYGAEQEGVPRLYSDMLEKTVTSTTNNPTTAAVISKNYNVDPLLAMDELANALGSKTQLKNYLPHSDGCIQAIKHVVEYCDRHPDGEVPNMILDDGTNATNEHIKDEILEKYKELGINTYTYARSSLEKWKEQTEIFGDCYKGHIQAPSRTDHGSTFFQAIKYNIFGALEGDIKNLPGTGLTFQKYNKDGSISTTDDYLIFNGLLVSNSDRIGYSMKRVLSKIKEAENGGLITTSQDKSNSITLNKINIEFGNYISSNNRMLSSLEMSCHNILKIAARINQMDQSLANSLTTLDFFTNEEYSEDYLIGLDKNNLSKMVSNSKLETIKLSKTSLISLLSSNLSPLYNSIENNKIIKKELDTFIVDFANNNKGPVYDAVKENLQQISEELNKEIKKTERFAENIKAAYQELYDYMEDMDELDTSKIPEYEAMIKELNSNNDELNALISYLETETYDIIDPKTKEVKTYPKDNSALISTYKAIIENNNKLIEKATKVLDKLLGLSGVDAHAATKIL